MTNRQRLIWQMIEMSDEELLRNFPGLMCDVHDKYIKTYKGDCGSEVLAWLKKEHRRADNGYRKNFISNIFCATYVWNLVFCILPD